MNYKLGRKPARFDTRALKMETYLAPNLNPPTAIDWGTEIKDWRMYLNDQLGDCTCAAAAHMIMNWTGRAGVLVTPPDQAILTAYEAVGHYVPNDPSTDNGAVELDVLKYWRNTGIAGHKIGAFIQINPKNIQHLKIATWLFGGIYTGVMLTQADMDAAQNGLKIWDHKPSPTIGGHAINATGYDAHGFKFITWGTEMVGTYNWIYNQMEEAYAIVSQDWIANTGKAPSGFNMAQLITDLNLVRN